VILYQKAETLYIPSPLLLFFSQTANDLNHLFAASLFGPTRKVMILFHEYWRHALNIPAGGIRGAPRARPPAAQTPRPAQSLCHRSGNALSLRQSQGDPDARTAEHR
jgi:hypothetical protein